ncbi:hypothetical protein BH20ACT2_BH20ACT2_15880 [soil metagenome]
MSSQDTIAREADGPRSTELGPLAGDLASASLVLATRFAAGATLWCWSPATPADAEHVAVEFVHPVIMGKRALPAVALTDVAPVDAVRQLGHPGDVLLVLGSSHEAALVDVVRRAEAWGMTTLWLGAGAPPAAGAADHVLWWPGDEDDAVHGGRWTLLYHLLWELTHLCFEQPGLLRPAADAGRADGTTLAGGADLPDETVCVTCRDEGRLGEVVSGDDDHAQVRTADGIEAVDTTLVGERQPHDLVLIHAGTAIAVVDPVADGTRP